MYQQGMRQQMKKLHYSRTYNEKQRKSKIKKQNFKVIKFWKLFKHLKPERTAKFRPEGDVNGDTKRTIDWIKTKQI